ncbi:MAG: glutamine-hydrolyzing GMP synthase [Thermoproteota archaeon]
MNDPIKFIEENVQAIRERVGTAKAVVAASGGVDSTTTALLGKRALGENLIVLFLDDGLMRDGEPDSVVEFYRKLGLNVRLLDVREKFLKAMRGLRDPEEKRRAFRETFYRVLSRALNDIGARFLLQGTIAADVVETKKGVKTQHNVLEQIGIDTAKTYGYELIEPLKDLYKDEVRKIAKALGLPLEKVDRRPFPGPGLSIRILGEVTKEKVELVRKATAIVEEETRGIECFQAFAVLASDRATGVSESGSRAYGNIIIIRIVDSKDAMTAVPSEIPWVSLGRIRDRILKEVPSVTRVLYDITPKPPATIEFE